MTTRKFKYEGTIEELRKDVAATGVPGKWQRMPQGYWRYLSSDQAILNWWPSTDTMTFQGAKRAAMHLELRLYEVTRSFRTAIKYGGDIMELIFDLGYTCIPGKWCMTASGDFKFFSSDGAILKWRSSTGELTFSGKRDAAIRLECKLFEVAQSFDCLPNASGAEGAD